MIEALFIWVALAGDFDESPWLSTAEVVEDKRSTFLSDEIEILVPRLGLTVTEVTFIEWLVDEGEDIAEGDAICLVESDKTQQEIEAPASGRLRRGAKEGITYEIGSALGAILPD